MCRPLLIFAICLAITNAFAYEPLAIPANKPAAPLDLTVHDKKRERDVPLRVYLPVTTQPAPVVLFSHGLGGTREGSSYLGLHWAARGYAVVFLQHAGSDSSVWKDKPPAERMRSMQSAANLENLLARTQDVPAVLDQLEKWNKDSEHPLAGKLDLTRIAMSGHSFGAVTTQAVSGQSFPRRGQRFTDPRIKAALVFSPSSPKLGDATTAFAGVKIPWMLFTGTKDIARIGNQTIGVPDMSSRLAVYPALPAGGKYEVVFHEADHSAFTDRSLPGGDTARNPNHHRAILALSTAFLDAYLKDQPEAKAWLDGENPRKVLESQDRWQRK